MSPIPATVVFKEWMKDPEYRAEYERTQPAFDLMKALIGARVRSGLTQEQISERMGTTQSAVARLEGWTANPSVKTLRKYAEATGTRLVISFEPVDSDQSSTDIDAAVKNGSAAVEKADVEVEDPVSTLT